MNVYEINLAPLSKVLVGLSDRIASGGREENVVPDGSRTYLRIEGSHDARLVNLTLRDFCCKDDEISITNGYVASSSTRSVGFVYTLIIDVPTKSKMRFNRMKNRNDDYNGDTSTAWNF